MNLSIITNTIILSSHDYATNIKLIKITANIRSPDPEKRERLTKLKTNEITIVRTHDLKRLFNKSPDRASERISVTKPRSRSDERYRQLENIPEPAITAQ